MAGILDKENSFPPDEDPPLALAESKEIRSRYFRYLDFIVKQASNPDESSKSLPPSSENAPQEKSISSSKSDLSSSPAENTNDKQDTKVGNPIDKGDLKVGNVMDKDDIKVENPIDKGDIKVGNVMDKDDIKVGNVIDKDDIKPENRNWIQWFSEYKVCVNTKSWTSKEELLKKVDDFIVVLHKLPLSTDIFIAFDTNVSYPIVSLYTSNLGYILFFSHSYNFYYHIEKTNMFNNCLALYAILQIEVNNLPYNQDLPELTYRGTVMSMNEWLLLQRVNDCDPFLKTVVPHGGPLISTSESQNNARKYAIWGSKKVGDIVSTSRPVLWVYRFLPMDEALIKEFERFCPRSKLGRTVNSLIEYSDFSVEQEWIFKSHALQISDIDLSNDTICQVKLLALDYYLEHCARDCDRFIFWILKMSCIFQALSSSPQDTFSTRAQDGLACIREDLFAVVTKLPSDTDIETQQQKIECKFTYMIRNKAKCFQRFCRWHNIFEAVRYHEGSHVWTYFETKANSEEDLTNMGALHVLDSYVKTLNTNSVDSSIINHYNSLMSTGYLEFKNRFFTLLKVPLEEDFMEFISSSRLQLLASHFMIIAFYLKQYYLRLLRLMDLCGSDSSEVAKKFDLVQSHILVYCATNQAKTLSPENFEKFKNGIISMGFMTEESIADLLQQLADLTK